MISRSNLQKFIGSIEPTHRNKHNYDKVVYLNNHTKICIGCPTHGDFWQLPKNHINGQGCPKCGGTSKMSNQEFIEKARKTHHYKFTYERTSYTGSNNSVIITCPDHGDFKQEATAHLQGYGCLICARRDDKLTLPIFIDRGNKKHNSKFSYEKCVYVDMHTKVLIVCPKHGDFKQEPSAHLNGQGCPTCRESKGERSIRRELERLGISFQPQYRIKNCRNVNTLPFDFGLFRNGKLCGMIEFHGKQHYDKFNFGSKSVSDDEMFRQIQERDKIKETYCIKNNIPLLIIPYWDHKTIPVLLEKFLYYQLTTNFV